MSRIRNDLTIVIPTLGGKILEKTLESINSGSKVPSLILVCIPEGVVFNLPDFTNIKIVRCKQKGQVAQRIEGFKQAITPLVMQLDDDILLEYDCLKILCETAEQLGKAAITPAMLSKQNGGNIYQVNHQRLINRIYYWLINGEKGYQPGTVTAVGSSFGHAAGNGLIESEWVPGGCVMHKKGNLILDDYYPFPGKAYMEDVYQSYYLQKMGVSLYIKTEAICYVDTNEPVFSMPFKDFLSYLKDEYQKRKCYIKLRNFSTFRMNLYYALKIMAYLFSVIERKRSRNSMGFK